MANQQSDIAALKRRLDELEYNIGLIARILVGADSRHALDPDLLQIAGCAPAKGSRKMSVGHSGASR